MLLGVRNGSGLFVCVLIQHPVQSEPWTFGVVVIKCSLGACDRICDYMFDQNIAFFQERSESM